jgi:hypothetical protein
MDPSVDTDRVLNGPTNDKWLIPWVEYLKEMGVKFFQGAEATEIHYSEETQQIASVVFHQNHQKITATGDYFLMAMPVGTAKQRYFICRPNAAVHQNPCPQRGLDEWNTILYQSGCRIEQGAHHLFRYRVGINLYFSNPILARLRYHKNGQRRCKRCAEHRC